MLDYYDRCYDHEAAKQQAMAGESLDLMTLCEPEAAELLLQKGQISGAA